MQSSSRVIRILLAVAIVAVPRFALAEDSATQSIDIPAQDLGTALLKFATVTHRQIAFDRKLVEGYESTAVSGPYTVTEGLHALIGGAPFQIRTTPSGVLAITAAPAALAAAPAAAPAQRRAAPSPTSSNERAAATSGALPQVTVQAKRAELAPKVTQFVYGIAALKDPAIHGGLTRWEKGMCPLVSGLPRQEGEFVLGRVSEIAEAAGVPVGKEHCHPNLYILVTSQPKELLEGMQKRNRIFTFGQKPFPAVVDEFISKPRPVKVWYNTSTYDAYGLPPGDGDPGSVFTFLVITKADSSRLISNVKYSFSRVFVIADQAHLHGVSRGQFAAYAAMVGLAELKPNARVGEAPTILKLFDGAPESAPADLSDWDKAFLKALYATEQRSNLQESAISRSMVRDIAP